MTGRSLVVAVLMWFAAGLSVLFTPKLVERAPGERIELERLFPMQLGSWNVDPSIIPIQPAPDVQASLQLIFSQILTRTYINDHGRRIMLSVSYGDGIDRQLDVHRPEVCYPSQGFAISKHRDEVVSWGEGVLPVRRLVAKRPGRNEPITYWIVTGGSVVANTTKRKLLKVVHGLSGRIEDGMLVRISSIESDEAAAYQLHAQFIQDLATHAPAKSRVEVFGRP